MDIFQTLGTYAIILWVVVPCTALLILYSVIRTAVARGLQDHQKWMEKNRPLVGQAPARTETIGQYLGFSGGQPEPPATGN